MAMSLTILGQGHSNGGLRFGSRTVQLLHDLELNNSSSFWGVGHSEAVGILQQ